MVLPGELGFGLLPRQGLRSLGLALIAGLGFGVWMALADASLFASAIPEVQRLMTAQMTRDIAFVFLYWLHAARIHFVRLSCGALDCSKNACTKMFRECAG